MYYIGAGSVLNWLVLSVCSPAYCHPWRRFHVTSCWDSERCVQMKKVFIGPNEDRNGRLCWARMTASVTSVNRYPTTAPPMYPPPPYPYISSLIRSKCQGCLNGPACIFNEMSHIEHESSALPLLLLSPTPPHPTFVSGNFCFGHQPKPKPWTTVALPKTSPMPAHASTPLKQDVHDYWMRGPMELRRAFFFFLEKNKRNWIR